MVFLCFCPHCEHLFAAGVLIDVVNLRFETKCRLIDTENLKDSNFKYAVWPVSFQLIFMWMLSRLLLCLHLAKKSSNAP